MPSTTQEVAIGLTALVKEQKYREATETYYAQDVVSTEPFGDPATVNGIDAVKAKLDWFEANFQVNSGSVDGPFICDDIFAVEYTIDATNKISGQRNTMHEVAVYTVADGKIVAEKFLNRQ